MCHDPDQTPSKEILHTIQDLGFKVPTSRKELPITGMSCANCAATIERQVGRLDGVSRAAVNFASERAEIAYDPAIIGLPKVVAAVRKAVEYFLR